MDNLKRNNSIHLVNTIFSFLLFLACVFTSLSQDSLKHKKVKVLPVPNLGYSPETSTYVGAVALFTLNLYNDSTTRSSNAKIEFNYTFRKQVIAESEWNYFFKKESWFTQGTIHYSKYPDFYFGIGSSTKEVDLIRFQSNRFKSEVYLLKNLGKKWFFGGGFRYINYSNISIQEGETVYPEIRSIATSGVLTTVLNDTRNNLLTPTSGRYLKLYNSHNFSEKYYSQIALDLRKYNTIGNKKQHIFSNRFFSQHIIGAAPFYDLALIGGDKLVRGYFYGRFRDMQLTTFQSEYRFTVYKWFGLAAFGGVTAIYSDLNSFNGTNIKPNVGAGCRIRVDKKEKTNLRFDYAIGAGGQTGFYVSFGESF